MISASFLKYIDTRNNFDNKNSPKLHKILIDLINESDLSIRRINNKKNKGWKKSFLIRKTKGYKKAINVVLENIEQIYNKKDLLNIFCDFNVNDFDDIFNKIKNTEKFVQSFLVFDEDINIYNKNAKFQAIKDFFTIILKREDIESIIINLSEECNEVLDTHKKNIKKRVENLDTILEQMNQLIHTSEPEKKAFGEVFTHYHLINEMLDTLPKSVWINPHLKWLDPANGYGNFPIIIVQRLMESLKVVSFLSDYETRLRWIMKNMIFVCDINIKNMKVFLELFDREGKMKLHINSYRGSFLNTEGFRNKMDEWKVDEFDIIIGNPPFQKSNVVKGQSHLYPLFIKKSADYLKRNGFLLFISPPTFLKTKLKVISDMQILHLNLKKEIKEKYFLNEDTTFSYYLLRKSRKMINTHIVSDNIEFDIEINRRYLIPLNNPQIESYSIIKKVYDYNSPKRLSFDRNKSPFPKVAAFVRRQNRYDYFNCLKTYDGFEDNVTINQDYTMEQDVNQVVRFLNSKLMSYIYYQYSTSPFITKQFINKIPYPEIDITNFSDDDIFKLYKLSENEIDEILKVVKNNTVKFPRKKQVKIIEGIFKVGEKYQYNGKSRIIKNSEVELIKILATSFKVKDIIGNIATVAKSTLKK